MTAANQQAELEMQHKNESLLWIFECKLLIKKIFAFVLLNIVNTVLQKYHDISVYRHFLTSLI